MHSKLARTVAIIEGAIIIACELGFGHLITPYYGTSLQVWTTTIIGAMLGMSFGYFTSIFLTKKIQIRTILNFFVYFSIYIGMISVFQKQIIQFSIDLPYSLGLFICTFLFIFINVFGFSIVLPILINKLSSSSNETASNTGEIYFYSTISSIIFSLLLGFYMFEKFGVQYSITILALISAVTLLLIISVNFKTELKHISIVSILILTTIALNKEQKIKGEIYRSDGLLGQLIVQDFGSGQSEGRRLFLNGSIQTMIYKSSGDSYGHYPFLIRSLVKYAKNFKNKNALLLGLGGGTIANELSGKGYQVTGIELDSRISEVAKKYFYPGLDFESIVMDGRFFINQTEEKYQYIVLDVFTSENPPYHLLSKEAFQRISELLTDDGVLLINFNGFWTGKKGFASKAMLKTLINTGYKVNLYPTMDAEDHRNAIFYASKQKLDTPNQIQYMNGAISQAINYSMDDLKYVPILEDKKPILPILNLGAATTWRRYGIEFLKSEGI